MFELTIVSPEGIFYEEKAVSLTVTTELGEIMILVDHAPLVAVVLMGEARIHTRANRTLVCATGNGALVVERTGVKLIVDSISDVGLLNYQQVVNDEEKLVIEIEKLKKKSGQAAQISRLERQLIIIRNQIRVLKKRQK